MCLYSKTIWITLIGFTDIKKKKKTVSDVSLFQKNKIYISKTKYDLC